MTPEKPDRPRPASAWEALDGHIAQHDRMVARHDRDPVPEDGSVPQTPPALPIPKPDPISLRFIQFLFFTNTV